MSSTQPDGQTDRHSHTQTHTDSLTCHSPGYQPAVSALYWPPCGSEDQQNSPGEPQNYLDEHDRNQKTFIIKEESKVFLLVGQVGSGDRTSPDPTLITVFLCFARFERKKKKQSVAVTQTAAKILSFRGCCLDSILNQSQLASRVNNEPLPRFQVLHFVSSVVCSRSLIHNPDMDFKSFLLVSRTFLPRICKHSLRSRK